MVDDFHGEVPYHGVYNEWQVFLTSMNKVFPDRLIEDISDRDPIFHTLWDLDDRFQVPGEAHLRQGCKNCNGGGVVPRIQDSVDRGDRRNAVLSPPEQGGGAEDREEG